MGARDGGQARLVPAGGNAPSCHSERSEKSVPAPPVPCSPFPVPPGELRVLYCDRELLVCEKPTDCLSEPGPGKNLPALAAAWLREHGEDPAVRTVHRLDKAVGGLMVLARTHRAAASLIDQIAARTAEKEYLAVLRGVPEQDEAVLEDLLFHDSRVNKTFVVRRPRAGVRAAKLFYRVLGQTEADGGPLTLVQIRLLTGRTHQIRAQFSARGLPLYGDARYGGGSGPLALWSCRLSFPHPETGYRVKHYQAPPDCAPWDLFRSVLPAKLSPLSPGTESTDQ